MKYFENGEEDRPFNGARTKDGLVSFMMKEPNSEPLPETQGIEIFLSAIHRLIGLKWEILKNWALKSFKNLGNLVKLVGKNFEDLVVNNESDVFIKFYAPWCGHCKAMAEDWAKLADEYADDKSMVIAEFDATANDTREF